MGLDRSAILAAAREILQSYGLADLSMRRIATKLGVQPGALYWHIDNKQALLAALSDEFLSSLPCPQGKPSVVVTTWAHALREALLAHRDAAELVASVLAMRMGSISPIAHLAALLPEHPTPELTASAVTHFVLGHCADEQGHAQLVRLGVTQPEPERSAQVAFAHGLKLLVAGMEQTVPDQSSRS